MSKVCIDTVFMSFIKILNKTLDVHLMSIYNFYSGLFISPEYLLRNAKELLGP
jgi:hypothetical protein